MNLYLDPVLLNIPTAFTTERMLLRCPQPGDGEAYHAAVQDSLAELRPWFDLSGELNPEDCEKRMRVAQAYFIERKSFEFLMFMQDSGRLVGRVGLYAAHWSTPSFEMGYWVRTPDARQGLMTEAVVGLTRFAIERLHACRIAIFCSEHNLPSAAVARRAGYRFEGTLHNDRRNFKSGELMNSCVFAFTP